MLKFKLTQANLIPTDNPAITKLESIMKRFDGRKVSPERMGVFQLASNAHRIFHMLNDGFISGNQSLIQSSAIPLLRMQLLCGWIINSKSAHNEVEEILRKYSAYCIVAFSRTVNADADADAESVRISFSLDNSSELIEKLGLSSEIKFILSQIGSGSDLPDFYEIASKEKFNVEGKVMSLDPSFIQIYIDAQNELNTFQNFIILDDGTFRISTVSEEYLKGVQFNLNSLSLNLCLKIEQIIDSNLKFDEEN